MNHSLNVCFLILARLRLSGGSKVTYIRFPSPKMLSHFNLTFHAPRANQPKSRSKERKSPPLSRTKTRYIVDADAAQVWMYEHLRFP